MFAFFFRRVLYNPRAVRAAGSLIAELLEPRLLFAGVTHTWTGSISNRWDVAGNWDHGVPTASDTAWITKRASIVLGVNEAVADIRLPGLNMNGAVVEIDTAGHQLDVGNSTTPGSIFDNGPSTQLTLTGGGKVNVVGSVTNGAMGMYVTGRTLLSIAGPLVISSWIGHHGEFWIASDSTVIADSVDVQVGTELHDASGELDVRNALSVAGYMTVGDSDEKTSADLNAGEVTLSQGALLVVDTGEMNVLRNASRPGNTGDLNVTNAQLSTFENTYLTVAGAVSVTGGAMNLAGAVDSGSASILPGSKPPAPIYLPFLNMALNPEVRVVEKWVTRDTTKPFVIGEPFKVVNEASEVVAAGGVDARSSARFSGLGRIVAPPGTRASGPIIVPGGRGGNDIGTLTIDSDLSGAVNYDAQTADDGNSDLLNVTGNANLSGSAIVVSPTGNSLGYTSGKTFTLLTAENFYGSTFANLPDSGGKPIPVGDPVLANLPALGKNLGWEASYSSGALALQVADLPPNSCGDNASGSMPPAYNFGFNFLSSGLAEIAGQSSSQTLLAKIATPPDHALTANDVAVDWGDGEGYGYNDGSLSVEDLGPANGEEVYGIYWSHTYAEAGNYQVGITVDGTAVDQYSRQFGMIASRNVEATVTDPPRPDPVSNSNGFGGGGSTPPGMGLNGGTIVTGSGSLGLTDGGVGETSSAFTTGLYDVSAFSSSFDLQVPASAANAGSGMAFVLQEAGSTAVGSSGSALGVGGIQGAVAVGFFQSGGISTTELYANGAVVGSPLSMLAAGVDLNSGHIFHVNLSYDGTTLYESVTDATGSSHPSFTTSYTIDIRTALGHNQHAYAGFTASTGSDVASSAAENVLGWSFGPPSLAATPGNDSFYVKLNGDGLHADVWINAVTPGNYAPTQSFLLTSLPDQLAVGGSGGSESLTVDFSNGDPIPRILAFNGGAGANTLTFVGDYGGDTFTADTAGSLLTISSPYFDAVTVAYAEGTALVVNGGGWNDTLAIAGDDAGDTFGVDASTVAVASPVFGSAAITYNNIVNLTVNGGAGDDVLTQTAQPGAGLAFNGGDGSDTLNIDAGAYTFDADAQVGTTNLTVNDNGSVVFSTGQNLAALNIGAGATAQMNADSQALNLAELSIDPAGQLDLANNSLLLTYGDNTDPAESIRSWIASGYHGGAWDGNGLITSAGDSYTNTLNLSDGVEGGADAGTLLVSFGPYGTTNLAGTGIPITLIDGAPSTGGIATFTDGNLNSGAGDFTATIDWGDGQTSTGAIAENPGGNGSFIVVEGSDSAAHSYASTGLYTVVVQVGDMRGSTVQIFSTATVFVSAPTDLSASGPSDREINLAWTADVDGSPTFNIYRSTDANFTPSPDNQIAYGIGPTSYSDTQGLKSDTAYYYRVTAVRNGVESGPTDAVQAATAPASLQTQGQSLSATIGQSLDSNSLVAFFADDNIVDQAGSFTGTIDWGDGTVTTADVIADPAGGFDVVGSHTYAQAGSDEIIVTILDAGGAATSIFSTASIAPTLTGTRIVALVGHSYNNPVALLTSGNPNEVRIDWGDGQSSAGAVQAGTDPGTFVVTDAGGHIYGAKGAYTVTVTVGSTNAPTVVGTFAALVEYPILPGGVDSGMGGLTGDQISAGATFIDTDSSLTAADFQAWVAWSDGQTSVASVIEQPTWWGGMPGIYTVSADHTYTAAGVYVVSTTLRLTGAAGQEIQNTQSTMVPISDGQFAVNGMSFNMILGQTFTVPIATFTDTATTLNTADFQVSINLGNGSSSSGQVEADPNNPGSFIVTACPGYFAAGQYSVYIYVWSPADGTYAATYATATVLPAAPTALLDVWNQADSSRIGMSWHSPYDGNHSYNVYRSTDPSSTPTADTLIASNVSATWYIDTQGLKSDTAYYYRLTQVQNGFESASSDVAQGSTAPANLQAQGQNIAANVGSALSGGTALAVFTDDNPNDQAGDFTATIDWGDGQTSAAVVQANPTGDGSFIVIEYPNVTPHVYATGGPYTVTIAIAGGGAAATAYDTIIVS